MRSNETFVFFTYQQRLRHYRDETVTIKSKVWCNPRRLNPSPSACVAEAIAMNYQNYAYSTQNHKMQKKLLRRAWP